MEILNNQKQFRLKMICKDLIFDVDGTLAETEELHREAFNLTFKKLCLNWHWDKNVYAKLLKVSGGRERLAHYQTLISSTGKTLSKETIIRIHKEKTTIYLQSLANPKLKLRPGVAQLINQAKSKNIKLAIATATSLVNVEPLVAKIWKRPVKEIFNAVATSNEVSFQKLSPEIYQLALKKLRIAPEYCIAIEDSLNGLKSTKGAGLKTIIIPSLYSKNDDFSLTEAVLPSFGDIKI